jgi:hypothetical protein
MQPLPSSRSNSPAKFPSRVSEKMMSKQDIRNANNKEGMLDLAKFDDDHHHHNHHHYHNESMKGDQQHDMVNPPSSQSSPPPPQQQQQHQQQRQVEVTASLPHIPFVPTKEQLEQEEAERKSRQLKHEENKNQLRYLVDKINKLDALKKKCVEEEDYLSAATFANDITKLKQELEVARAMVAVEEERIKMEKNMIPSTTTIATTNTSTTNNGQRNEDLEREEKARQALEMQQHIDTLYSLSLSPEGRALLKNRPMLPPHSLVAPLVQQIPKQINFEQHLVSYSRSDDRIPYIYMYVHTFERKKHTYIVMLI